MSSFSSCTEDDSSFLGEKEAALYDRQIRLWGVEAQNRMQKSKVFVSGFTGMHCEVVKNIVLAGISVVIHDSGTVEAQDLASNFFFTAADVGTSRATAGVTRVQEMNPLTSVSAEMRPLSELEDIYFKDFSVVLLGNCSETDVHRLNTLTRAGKTVLYWGGCFGMEGWFVCDYGPSFEFKEDQKQGAASQRVSRDNSSSSTSTTPAIHTISFPSIKQALAVPWNTHISRRKPLSPVYVKARVLAEFHTSRGRLPNPTDAAAMKALTTQLLSANNVTDTAVVTPILESLDHLCVCSGSVIPVVSAVVGGLLAQEVLKAVSLVGQPMQNIFVFDGMTNEARTFPSAMPKQAPKPTVASAASEDVIVL